MNRTDTQQQKRCSVCLLLKPPTSKYFSKEPRRFDGLESICRACETKRLRAYYIKNRDRIIEYNRRYSRRQYKADPTRKTLRIAARRKLIRQQVLAYYGKDGQAVCCCCDEHTLEFLCIDHVNGGGKEERKILRGESFYRYLLRDKPAGYQTLC